MKTSILALFFLSLLLNGCANKKQNAGTASNDSIEYKVHYNLTRPDPPYEEYDTMMVIKFANEEAFKQWEKIDSIHKSAERVVK